eukprot:2206818-Pyramimonas_sp.AAC.1
MGSSTESFIGRVRMAYPHQHTPFTFRGVIGSCTEGPIDRVRMAYPHPMLHTLHTFRGPIGSTF